MFDLNYYNEITDFGKLCDEIINKVRVMGCTNNVYTNKTDKKIQKVAHREEMMNKITLFHNKYGKDYYVWYVRYFKNDIKIIDSHSNMCNQQVVLKKLIKPHHIA
jgi:hypothetical protein